MCSAPFEGQSTYYLPAYLGMAPRDYLKKLCPRVPPLKGLDQIRTNQPKSSRTKTDYAPSSTLQER